LLDSWQKKAHEEWRVASKAWNDSIDKLDRASRQGKSISNSKRAELKLGVVLARKRLDDATATFEALCKVDGTWAINPTEGKS